MRQHTTGEHEELLVFLQGRATVVVAGTPVEMAAGEVLYMPPNTVHEVHNGGSEETRYIYTVAPTR
jgi:mannose-6-phosphate isomerase-like protein (cupin superfamily)